MLNSKKDLLLYNLPIQTEDFLIRRITRADMEYLSKWPHYPWPFDVFRFSFGGQTNSDLDFEYNRRSCDDSRITFVVDTEEVSVIGYIALVQVDWGMGIANNISFRIRPDFCDQGIGSCVISEVCDLWFGIGMNSIRLDVAATNHRAVRCYERVGFLKTGEFWREAHDLVGKDLNKQKYFFLGNDVDCTPTIPRIRFLWMEKAKEVG